MVITGVYGTGKSSVAEEMADRLERERVSYAAIDLDWLGWFDTGGGGNEEAAERVFLANLRAIVDNYLRAGVERFVLAGSVADRDELGRLAAVVPIPLRVVWLHAPFEDIERRLLAAPTTGRRNDLQVAEKWLAEGIGTGIDDFAVENTGSIQDAATTILDWLGRTPTH